MKQADLDRNEIIDKDEVLKMARQAGMVQDGDVWFSANNYEQCDVHTAELEAFAKLVADVATAKEREACAKVCEDIERLSAGNDDAPAYRYYEAIRARAKADRGEQHES